jgi:hypothetical protein
MAMDAFEDRGECARRDSAASPGPGTERKDDTSTLRRRGGEFVNQPVKSRYVHEFKRTGAVRKQVKDAPADVFDQPVGVGTG